MRIRTDGKFSYRKDEVERIAEYYGCNQTRALLLAGEDVELLVDAVLEALEDEELSLSARRALLERFDDASPRFSFDFEAGRDGVDADVEVDP